MVLKIKSLTRRSSTHTSCAGQFVSRGFVVLLRKSNPQSHNLQTAAVRDVMQLYGKKREQDQRAAVGNGSG